MPVQILVTADEKKDEHSHIQKKDFSSHFSEHVINYVDSCACQVNIFSLK